MKYMGEYDQENNKKCLSYNIHISPPVPPIDTPTHPRCPLMAQPTPPVHSPVQHPSICPPFSSSSTIDICINTWTSVTAGQVNGQLERLH